MNSRTTEVKAALAELMNEAGTLLDSLQNMTDEQFLEKRPEMVSALGDYIFKINYESNKHDEISDAAVRLPSDLLRSRDLRQWIERIEAAISELEFWRRHFQ